MFTHTTIKLALVLACFCCFHHMLFADFGSGKTDYDGYDDDDDTTTSRNKNKSTTIIFPVPTTTGKFGPNEEPLVGCTDTNRVSICKSNKTSENNCPLYHKNVCLVLVACIKCGISSKKVIGYDLKVRNDLKLSLEWSCKGFKLPRSLDKPICASNDDSATTTSKNTSNDGNSLSPAIQMILVLSLIFIVLSIILFSMLCYFCYCFKRQKVEANGKMDPNAQNSSFEDPKSPKTDPVPKMSGKLKQLSAKHLQTPVSGGNYPHMSKLPSKVSTRLLNLMAENGGVSASRKMSPRKPSKYTLKQLKKSPHPSGRRQVSKLAISASGPKATSGVGGGGKSKVNGPLKWADDNDLLLMAPAPVSKDLTGSALSAEGGKGGGVSGVRKRHSKSRKKHSRKTDSKVRHHSKQTKKHSKKRSASKLRKSRKN